MPKNIAIGDNDGDACMLQAADIGIAYEPKTRRVAKSANHCISGNIASALECIDRDSAAIDAQWSTPYYASRFAGDGL